jgi:outer membrane putative beta-barrel porin/alpha-amylase
LKRIIGAAAVFAAISQPALAQNFIQWPQDVSWQVGSGLDYSEGKYGGTTKTTILAVPIDARVELDRFRFDATLPWENVSGPGILAGGVVVGSGPAGSRSGLGDLDLTGAFTLTHDEGALPAIDIGGSIKFPTAKSDLGTGKFDYSIQGNVYHSFTPQLMLFGSVGYQWLTSTSTIALKDGVTASGGANYKLTDAVSIGLSANFRQEYFDSLGDQFTISPYLLWNLMPNWRVSAYATAGTGNASPEFGAGGRLIFYQSG